MHFRSKVIAGEGRGRKLGFPTINLVIPVDFKFKKGVYAVRVEMDSRLRGNDMLRQAQHDRCGNDRIIKGVLHFGPRETFNEMKNSLEIHLLDWSEDLYNQKVGVEVLQKLRQIKQFDSAEELKCQIKQDIVAAQVVFKKNFK